MKHKQLLKNKVDNLNKKYQAVSLAIIHCAVKRQNTFMFALGTLLLVGGLVETNHAFACIAGICIGGGDFAAGVFAAGGGVSVGGNPTQACSRILGYIEGGFGALVATGAGLGAIIAAALGGFKAAWTLIVVSVGCFILRSYLTLFHGGCRAL